MRKITRLLGFILVALGYIQLLLWFAHTIVPLPRSIFVEMDDKYPPTRVYSHTEVLDAVGGVITRYKENSIEVIAPASLILLGGILLGISGRVFASQNSKKESDETSCRDYEGVGPRIVTLFAVDKRSVTGKMRPSTWPDRCAFDILARGSGVGEPAIGNGPLHPRDTSN